MIDVSTLLLLALALALAILVAWRYPERLPEVWAQLRKQGATIALRTPFALLLAAYVSTLVPSSVIAPLLGEASGWTGILLACVLGGMLPGGPMVSFPLALVVWHMGAGEAQMVGFLASWSIYAVHRVIIFEWPMMGARFVVIRLAASWMLPPVAAFFAVLLLQAF